MEQNLYKIIARNGNALNLYLDIKTSRKQSYLTIGTIAHKRAVPESFELAFNDKGHLELQKNEAIHSLEAELLEIKVAELICIIH